MPEPIPKRNILVLENEGGVWGPFLEKYFSDVPVTLLAFHKSFEASEALVRLSPRMIFVDPSFLNLPLIQKIRVRKQTDPQFRVYTVSAPESGKKDPLVDAVFPEQPAPEDFAKRWTETVSVPETVRLLVIDDEEEIAGMVRDYFEGRKNPSFEIFFSENGKKGLETLEKEKPDLIILDIKMPVMDGREFYAELKRRKIEIPVIVFFDSISGEEMDEIRKYGDPPVVEKGAVTGSLPALMQLVKKMICFRLETRDQRPETRD